MNPLSLEEGRLLVRLARRAIESKLTGEALALQEDIPAVFRENKGVFVTLKTHEGENLRGCIGFPEPIMPLVDALLNAALAAALKDPRFPPVTPEEMDGIIIEVTALSQLEPVPGKTPDEIKNNIKIGTHGLLVRYITGRAGLLLPQVPVENGWGVEEFLGYTCMKAGMPKDTWMHPDCAVFRFTGQVFQETEPRGEVVEVKLGK
ncbi:MAG: TIGR00296 family protein [candidate division WOR-3 bacterium]